MLFLGPGQPAHPTAELQPVVHPAPHHPPLPPLPQVSLSGPQSADPAPRTAVHLLATPTGRTTFGLIFLVGKLWIFIF